MNHLVIMAKQPIAGRVKSRLAKDIGIARATGLYRTLMTTTMRALAQDPRWKTWAAVAPDRAVFDHPWPVDAFGQGSGNLGNRMQRIFDVMPSGPVVIIGTDIPAIQRNDVAWAFRRLGSKDLVFAEAGDGGFWLVGARRTPRIPRVFENVRWSGEYALSDTLENARKLAVGYTTTRYDIDTKADYLRWRRSEI